MHIVIIWRVGGVYNNEREPSEVQPKINNRTSDTTIETDLPEEICF